MPVVILGTIVSSMFIVSYFFDFSLDQRLPLILIVSLCSFYLLILTRKKLLSHLETGIYILIFVSSGFYWLETTELVRFLLVILTLINLGFCVSSRVFTNLSAIMISIALCIWLGIQSNINYVQISSRELVQLSYVGLGLLILFVANRLKNTSEENYIRLFFSTVCLLHLYLIDSVSLMRMGSDNSDIVHIGFLLMSMIVYFLLFTKANVKAKKVALFVCTIPCFSLLISLGFEVLGNNEIFVIYFLMYSFSLYFLMDSLSLKKMSLISGMVLSLFGFSLLLLVTKSNQQTNILFVLAVLSFCWTSLNRVRSGGVSNGMD